jgi:hypothetical protein
MFCQGSYGVGSAFGAVPTYTGERGKGMRGERGGARGRNGAVRLRAGWRRLAEPTLLMVSIRTATHQPEQEGGRAHRRLGARPARPAVKQLGSGCCRRRVAGLVALPAETREISLQVCGYSETTHHVMLSCHTAATVTFCRFLLCPPPLSWQTRWGHEDEKYDFMQNHEYRASGVPSFTL